MSAPQIIFVSELPRDREAKIAWGLKQCGIASLLIYVNEPNNHAPSDHFDFTIKCQNAEEALAVASRLRPKLVHLSSYGADRTALLFLQNKIAKTVYDYKDCYENVMGWPQAPNFYAVQRFCVENADGICCRDLQLWNYCRVNRIRPRGKSMLFVDYCWHKSRTGPAKLGGGVHVVYAGNFAVEKAWPRNIDTGLLLVAKALVARGIHLHLYPHWHVRFISDDSQLSDYFEIAKQFPNFHIHAPVPMDKVAEEIGQYDYGMIVNQGSLFDLPLTSTMNGHEKHALANKGFDYLDAGLEVLVGQGLPLVRRVFAQKSVAVHLTKELLGDPVPFLSERKALGQSERVARAVENFAIARHIPRLLRFYASL